jgi:hypothetical protein
MNRSPSTSLSTEIIPASDRQVEVLSWLGKAGAPTRPYYSTLHDQHSLVPTSMDEQSPPPSSVDDSNDSSDEEETDSLVSSFYQFSLITAVVTTLPA